MSKVLIFAIVGLFVVTEIFARSADNKSSCGEHGDPCSQGCCNGYKCNAMAHVCQVDITGDMLKERHNKLKPVQSSHDDANCGKHGDPCSQGCCDKFSCNEKANKCMATITGDMLNEARSKLKHVEKRSVKNSSCGKHGDNCSQGCCNGFRCNAAAGRCMAIITEDMLKDARSKLKPVQNRPISNSSPNRSNDRTNCGKHGDDCGNGCCNGYVCNSAAGKCMATITEDMLKEGRAKLKPVNSRAIGA